MVKIDLSEVMKVAQPEIVHGDIAIKDMEVDRNYNILANDGIYASIFNGVMKVTRKIVDFGNARTGFTVLTPPKEGVELAVEKIPFKYYMMALDFSREIYKKCGTEAGLTIFVKSEDTDMEYLREKAGDGLIEDGELLIYCPYQRNTPALHKIRGEEVYEYLRENAYPYVEIHSHHTMGVRWSGTDDGNMRHTRGYTVFNHIYKFENTQTRTYFRGEFYDFDTSEIFELPWNVYDALSEDIDVGDEDVKTNLLNQVKQLQHQIESLGEFPKSWIERGDRESRLDIKSELYDEVKSEDDYRRGTEGLVMFDDVVYEEDEEDLDDTDDTEDTDNEVDWEDIEDEEMSHVDINKYRRLR